MSLIERLKEKLSRFPSLQYEATETTLAISKPCEGGFPVSVVTGSTEFTISLGDWHGHFESEEEVLDFVGFGLSECCRLKEFRRSGRPYKWIVESKTKGKWTPVYTTSLFSLRLWAKKEEIILQNNTIKCN